MERPVIPLSALQIHQSSSRCVEPSNKAGCGFTVARQAVLFPSQDLLPQWELSGDGLGHLWGTPSWPIPRPGSGSTLTLKLPGSSEATFQNLPRSSPNSVFPPPWLRISLLHHPCCSGVPCTPASCRLVQMSAWETLTVLGKGQAGGFMAVCLGLPRGFCRLHVCPAGCGGPTGSRWASSGTRGWSTVLPLIFLEAFRALCDQTTAFCLALSPPCRGASWWPCFW